MSLTHDFVEVLGLIRIKLIPDHNLIYNLSFNVLFVKIGLQMQKFTSAKITQYQIVLALL